MCIMLHHRRPRQKHIYALWQNISARFSASAERSVCHVPWSEKQFFWGLDCTSCPAYECDRLYPHGAPPTGIW